MKIRVIAITLITCLCSSLLSAQSDTADTKQKIAKWVETRQLISKEIHEWEIEQEFLSSTRDLLKEQIESLNDKIAELGDTQSEADKKRSELLLKRGELQRADEALSEKVAMLETQVKQLILLFPEPLVEDKLEKLIVRIPEDPKNSKLGLGQRLLTILGILGQAEKFNSSPTLVGETRDVGGKKIQVLTLYWGMAFAVYVDSQGTMAGIGSPSADGWVWEENNDMAGEAKLLIDMYEGNVDEIRFIELPISIK